MNKQMIIFYPIVWIPILVDIDWYLDHNIVVAIVG